MSSTRWALTSLMMNRPDWPIGQTRSLGSLRFTIVRTDDAARFHVAQPAEIQRKQWHSLVVIGSNLFVINWSAGFFKQRPHLTSISSQFHFITHYTILRRSNERLRSRN